MSSPITIVFHSSQFPDHVAADLIRSLRTRQVNHKFHYDSYRQTQHWLRLHKQFSPARVDPRAAVIYDDAFESVIHDFHAPVLHMISLGCGDGQKENRALRQLRDRRHDVIYSPVDISAPLVMISHRAAMDCGAACHAVVADLLAAADLGNLLDRQAPPGTPRLIIFFGMMPNFEPSQALGIFRKLLRHGDQLLISANLAPGNDYPAGVRQVLPQYDNELTRAWLLILLQDLGIQSLDGDLTFSIEPGEDNTLLRIVAWFQFTRSLDLDVLGERFNFAAGERLRLFFSYRYFAEQLHERLSDAGLRLLGQWLAPSKEEGVFRLEL